MSDELGRAESIIFLLNLKDVVFYPQVLPVLLALVYQSLIDGELSMHKSNRISTSSGIMCHSSPADNYGSLIK
ncbi:unnamed protein product [Schistosoma curassoni]|uniref:Ovule protein n=1 Tax=Schistosoma curassoni TaxID=6186 RepID=A0A183KNC7_9TREM|nr:unnamed protein product [Schistosoma curassoni]